MKIEQACRFRMDSGYGICARSPGSEPAQEVALGEVFNDSMNQIFPKAGTSVLSCALRGSYAFLARNTLRSDSHSRITIFTHSYIMSAEDYMDAMRHAPESLLSIPMSRLMDNPSGGSALETLELNGADGEGMDLDGLFKKYGLTPDRYSRLMVGAYEALTSNRPLCLQTNRPLSTTEQLVRELTYCILDGLLPVLKGRVTFSSGSDTRMNICVLHPEAKNARSAELVFGVEDDRQTKLRPRDEISAAFFHALGRSDHAGRSALLEDMESWLWEITNLDEGISVPLIATAYIYRSGKSQDKDLRLKLFRNITAAAGKTIPLAPSNALLTELVQQMSASGGLSTNELSFATEWYLMNSSPAYRAAVDQVLGTIGPSLSAALINQLVKRPLEGAPRQMALVLLDKLPADTPELTAAVRHTLARWIIKENIIQLFGFLKAVLSGYGPEQKKDLAGNILLDIRDRTMNDAEKAVLKACFRVVTANRLRFSQEECRMLDDHLAEFSPEMVETYITYLFQVRLMYCAQTMEMVVMIQRICNAAPGLRQRLVQEMSTGEGGQRYPQLWEEYQTHTVFTDDVTGEQIPMLLRHYNTFKTPDGPFERKACNIWCNSVNAKLVMMDTCGDGPDALAKTCVSLLKEASGLELSAKNVEALKMVVLNDYWKTLRYQQLLEGDLKIPFDLRVEVKESLVKMPLKEACGRIYSKPVNTQDLIDIVTDRDLDPVIRQEVQSVIRRLTSMVFDKWKIIVWDLLLLHCWRQGKEYDVDLLVTRARELQKDIIDKNARIDRMAAADSLLLQDPELRKQMIRKLESTSYDLPKILVKLIEELKAWDKGGKKSAGANAPAKRSAAPAQSSPAVRADRPRHATAAPQKSRTPFTEEPPARPARQSKPDTRGAKNPFVEDSPEPAKKRSWFSFGKDDPKR